MTTQTYTSETRVMTDAPDDLREQVARKIRKLEEELLRHHKVLEVLSEPREPEESPPPSDAEVDYQTMGVTEAAKRVLEEKKVLTTRELVDILESRGVKTKSKNFFNTTFSTLTKDKKHFARTKDKKWTLVKKLS